MRNSIKNWLYIIGILIITASCSKSNPDSTTPPTPPEPTPSEAYLQVSQYNPDKWDGVKRGGIYYEIFVRSFADSNGDKIGDLKGVTAKLDYLHSMGVEGIWLLPINPSPSYHGYDVDDYYGVNKDYGTMADFEELVSKAHSKGINVILDFVMNHTSKSHPMFVNASSSTTSEFRDFFLFSKNPETDIKSGLVPMTNSYVANQWHSVKTGTIEYKYMGMFSDWMPEINYGKVASCETSPAFIEMCKAAKFWLAKGVDGFRLDAVKHIYQNENSNENPEFLRKFREELIKTKPDVYIIGEMLSEHNSVAPYYKGLEALFDFSSWWRLEYAIKNHHAKWFPKDMIDYRKEYAQHRANYIQATKLSNHDEDRTRSVLNGSLDMSKLAAAIMLTSAGTPYIYYGEEIGMLGVKATGDENVRDPMLWAPAATDTYRTKWRSSTFSTDATVGSVESLSGDKNSIWCVYRKFTELRNTYPALAIGEVKLPDNFNDSDATNKNFMVYYREAPGQKFVVIHNVSYSDNTYTLDKAVKRPIADTKKTTLTKVSDSKYTIKMPPYSTIILEI